MVEIKNILYNSKAYSESLEIRNRILRLPLGMNIYDEDLSLDEKSILFCAYLNQKMIGTLILTPLNSGRIKMRQVAVDESYRGIGVGKALVLHAENYGKQHHYKEMILHARQSAVAFYEKLGYEVVSPVFTEVTIPHHKMKKVL